MYELRNNSQSTTISFGKVLGNLVSYCTNPLLKFLVSLLVSEIHRRDGASRAVRVHMATAPQATEGQ